MKSTKPTEFLTEIFFDNSSRTQVLTQQLYTVYCLQGRSQLIILGRVNPQNAAFTQF